MQLDLWEVYRRTLEMFQSSTRQTDFATTPAFPWPRRTQIRFNPLRGRQTLQRDEVGSGHIAFLVSILYEADRLCNPAIARAAWRLRPSFQSSTRQTDFATLPSAPSLGRGMFQSSTRQTDFATGGEVHGQGSVGGFQSSRRQTDFATPLLPFPLPLLPGFNPLRGRQTLQQPQSEPDRPPPGVSILYEADRLCNAGAGGLRGRVRLVSILYEADRLCNGGLGEAGRASPGVSILYEADRLCNGQVPLHERRSDRPVSILYEADRLCNVWRMVIAPAGTLVSILYEADRLCNCPCQEAAPDRGS